MLYPTELRAHAIYQSLMCSVNGHGLGKYSQLVRFEVVVKLLCCWRQVPLAQGLYRSKI